MSKEQRYDEVKKMYQLQNLSESLISMDKCAKVIIIGVKAPGSVFYARRQCGRKCGHGPDGAYCKQHSNSKR